ncbi:MAG: metallopeptidase family protein [Chloroflexi bacterium]|nr:metallopeptidase family protein [Chloroflexota bacterium]
MAARLSRREFERQVLKALEDLPKAIRERIENMDVVVRDWPNPEDLEEQGIPNRYGLLGLYQGIPLTERSHYNMALPDKITIYRHPIEAICNTREEVVQQVRKTVIHEVAHHFGISDEHLDSTEYG